MFLVVGETFIRSLLCCRVGIVQCQFSIFCIVSFGNCTRQHQEAGADYRLKLSLELGNFTECQNIISSTNAKSFTVLRYVREKKEPYTVRTEQYLKNNSAKLDALFT